MTRGANEDERAVCGAEGQIPRGRLNHISPSFQQLSSIGCAIGISVIQKPGMACYRLRNTGYGIIELVQDNL